MGAEGVKNAVKLARGEAVEREVPITPGLYIHGQGFVEVSIDHEQVTIER
jgi:ribose transport system substrate-binding protein